MKDRFRGRVSHAESRIHGSEFFEEFLVPVTEAGYAFLDPPTPKPGVTYEGVIAKSDLKTEDNQNSLRPGKGVSFLEEDILVSFSSQIKSDELTLSFGEKFAELNKEDQRLILNAMLFKASTFRKKLSPIIPEFIKQTLPPEAEDFFAKWESLSQGERIERMRKIWPPNIEVSEN